MRPATLSSPLLALVAVSVGCSVHPGLSNAPALGAVPPSGGRDHDVVANGRDSCERVGGGSPLREHLPPCDSDSSPEPPPLPSGLAALVHMGFRRPDLAPAGLEFLNLRWARCSRTLRPEDAYALRDPTVLPGFPESEWRMSCIQWMH